MKTLKIKTNLVTGIVMGILSIVLLLVMPSQVRLPLYDSGAPSPRIIPMICLVGILICSLVLIFESLVLKKEKIYEFDINKEKPVLVIIAMMLVFVGGTVTVGFVAAGIVIFCLLMFYCGERKIPIYIFTICAVVVIYLLFMHVFHVALPGFGGK